MRVRPRQSTWVCGVCGRHTSFWFKASEVPHEIQVKEAKILDGWHEIRGGTVCNVCVEVAANLWQKGNT